MVGDEMEVASVSDFGGGGNGGGINYVDISNGSGLAAVAPLGQLQRSASRANSTAATAGHAAPKAANLSAGPPLRTGMVNNFLVTPPSTAGGGGGGGAAAELEPIEVPYRVPVGAGMRVARARQ